MLSREQCLKEYGSDYYIQKKVESGELFRIDKGIYALKKHIPEIAIISFKYPNAVVTMGSAFYLYGLTDVIPDIGNFRPEVVLMGNKSGYIRERYIV